MKKEKIKLEILLFRFYILITIFEGVIRYILNSAGLSFLIYIKDLIILALLFLSVNKLKLKMTKAFSFGFLIISISYITAIIYVSNVNQILFFTLKVLLIFLVGCFQYKNIIEDLSNNHSFYNICYIFVAIGVISNSFVTFPWEGLEYSLGDRFLEASRSWTTTGVRRLAGFSRASYNASTQIAIFSLIITINRENKLKNIIAHIITIFVLILTTTKGMLATYIILMIINNFFGKKEKMYRFAITAAVTIMIVLPLFSLICDPIFNYFKENLDSVTYIRYFASFEERLKEMWPFSFEKISQEGNMILGKGIGGVGTAEYMYGNTEYTPCDNFFVYLYAITGIFSFLIIGWILFKIYKLKIVDKRDKLLYNIVCVIFIYGIAINIIEEPILCILLGTACGYLNRKI